MYFVGVLIFGIIIFVFSILVYDFLLKYLRNIGKSNSNGEVRWASSRKPAIGGITFFICFLLSCISLIYTISNRETFVFEEFYGIMLALCIGFLAGLFDDAYNTIPWLKLLLQIVCGLSLALTGTYIDVFDSLLLNYTITVFWVVGIMNAINLLDNMDAISTIVSIFIILASIGAMFILPLSSQTYFLLLLGVLVSLIAFLKYNFHPSKMYMGDTGSMFLGVFVAAFGILFFWNFKVDTGVYAPVHIRFLSVMLVFALPIIDTSTVFFKRLFLDRKSPFIGGKDHTTHHLSYLGMNDKMVALVFAGMSLFCAVMGLLVLNFASAWNNFYMLGFGTFFCLLLVFLFTISLMNRKRDEAK